MSAGPDATLPVPGRPPARTRRQWVTLGLGAVVLAALCVLAAVWQWHRYTAREDYIALVEANYDAAPVDVSTLLDGPGAVLADDDVWRPVTLTGTYRPQDTVLLRNRPVASTPGFHVLVPFEDESGIVIVVNRGFVPFGHDSTAPDAVPDPPDGEVTVTVTLRADEPESSRGAPAGQVQAISTAQVLAAGSTGASWADGRTVSAYGEVRAEDPAPTQALHGLPQPNLDPGSHLSYTVQWLIFAGGAIGGYVLLWRRETRSTAPTAGDLLVAAGDTPARPRRERRRRPSDEELEDALLGD